MNTVNSIQGTGPTMATTAVAPMPPEITAEQREIVQAVKAINASELFGQNNELTFVLDRESHRAIVRIIDRKTNELIRQIPPEYVLRMAQDLKHAESSG
jgi:flagellar protein FlaG